MMTAMTIKMTIKIMIKMTMLHSDTLVTMAINDNACNRDGDGHCSADYHGNDSSVLPVMMRLLQILCCL